MLDALESRDLCVRTRSATDRRSHALSLTEKGRVALARSRKIIASKHESRLSALLGPADRAALLRILSKIVREF
jgi:DNA-binding MarR family transcriptional regulator